MSGAVREENMNLTTIKQPPFNTSIMGVIRGVLDFYGIKISDAMAYAGSGHAFLINVHEVICSSGPYVWNNEGFIRLLRNLGLEAIDLGFVHAGIPAAGRAGLEQKVRQNLDQGVPCSVCNMDNQIITGYEADHLLLTQPWSCVTDITPLTLTFGTWAEFGKEIHANFFAFKKLPVAPEDKVIRESLEYAVDLFDNPGKYSMPKYGIGLLAYDNWLKGVEQGHGKEHGNWWNGTVWSECRTQAADYFAEIAGKLTPEAAASARDLSAAYREIASGLERISDKEMDPIEKMGIIKALKKSEFNAVNSIKGLLKLI
jgi:hypothetical protein